MSYTKGQVVEYHDRLSVPGVTENVVIDEVIDDSGTLLTSGVRYAVRFEGSDDVFVTDANRLGRVL